LLLHQEEFLIWLLKMLQNSINAKCLF
jgi:hypothetical protein